MQNLSLLFDEWIDVARFKFEDSAKNVVDAKKAVFSLVKSYIDMTAFFCKDESKYLALTVNRNIAHSKTALYDSESLKILWSKIEDIDLLPESFFHLMNVYLRPELNRFSQNFLIYYVFLSILNKLPNTDDVEPFKSSLQYYCDEILHFLDENFQSVVEFVYDREQNKSIKFVDIAKEDESSNNNWQNVLRIYYDKIGINWLKSPSLNDEMLLDYERYFESNAKTYFSNVLNNPIKSKLKRKSPEPRFSRQICAKRNDSRKMQSLDNSNAWNGRKQLENFLSQEDFKQVINSPLLKVENFRRKLSALDTSTASRSFADQKNSFLGSSSLNFSSASSPKPRKSILIDTSISSSARRSNNMTNVKECTLIKKFRFDLDELFAQDKSEKRMNFEENEAEKSIVPSDQSEDEMSLDHDHESTECDHDPKLTEMNHDPELTEIDHDSPSPKNNQDLESIESDYDRESTECDHDQELTEINQNPQSTKVNHDPESMVRDHDLESTDDQQLTEIDLDRQLTKFDQSEDDQTPDEQSMEVGPTNEDIDRTCIKERTLMVESFETSLASDSDAVEEDPNVGHKSDETLVINEVRQSPEADQEILVPKNDVSIPEMVSNIVEIETSPNTDDVFNPKIPLISGSTVENFRDDNVNDRPQTGNRKKTANEIVESNLNGDLECGRHEENQLQHHLSPKKSCDQGIQTSFIVVCLPKSNSSNDRTSENKNLTALKSLKEVEKKVESENHKQKKNIVEEQQPSVSATPKEPAKLRTRSLRRSPRRKSERISTRSLRSAKRNDDKTDRMDAVCLYYSSISDVIT
uniref:Uncharacterized protein n=1 Tax=Romanomermis culicivorax TaxID=13658 RepID=A0A915JNJ3_ROMCU